MDEPLQTRPAHAEQQAGKILVLPRYSRMGASSRLRFEAYFPALQDAGLAVESMPLWDDAHVRALYTGRSVARAGLVGAYLKRFGRLLRHSDCDLVWIEKEVFPWVPRIEELLLGNN